MGTITETVNNVINTEKIVRKEIYIDGRHEYDYLVDSLSSNVTIYSLYCSQDNEWGESVKGKLAIQLMDNGDGVEFNNLDLCKSVDYLEVEQLHILLRLYSQYSKYEMLDPLDKKEF